MSSNEWDEPTRQERREQRRLPKQKVNGKSVFLLRDLGGRPPKRKAKSWTRPRRQPEG